MKGLNAGPSEVVPGVKFLYASLGPLRPLRATGRPLCLWSGDPHQCQLRRAALAEPWPTCAAGVDHREASYDPRAFRHTYKFITGREPETLAIRSEAQARLTGRITGLTSGNYNNIGVEGARLAIYAVDRTSGVRLGGPVLHALHSPSGAWGRFFADPRPATSSWSAFPGSRSRTSTARHFRAAPMSSTSGPPRRSPIPRRAAS
jgi:hypothetical protein